MLAEPLSPVFDIAISLMILQVYFMAKPFGIPDLHVIIDLYCLCIQQYPADPVREPGCAEHLVVYSLLKFALRLNVLEENNLEEIGFEENVDKSWTHLHNRDIKEEGWPEDGQMHIIINRTKTVVLFVRKRLNKLVINSLLEIVDCFYFMLKKFR